MTLSFVGLAILAAAMIGFAVWAIWPRRQPGAGPHNGWRQRDGTEIESAKTDATGGNVSPIDVALGTGGAGIF